VPAAAVIPALIVNIKIAAVKTLVVALRRLADRSALSGEYWIRRRPTPGGTPCRLFGAAGNQDLYLEKIRVFKAGFLPEYVSME
jgi:hypothetical protein